MSTTPKLFTRKPPNGFLEISNRVYVFNCCFGVQHEWSEDRYKLHVDSVIHQFRTTMPEAFVLLCNFRDEETNANTFKVHDVIDYPRHHLGSPVLKMDDTWQFLRSCENWLSRGRRDIVLMHCERGAWPVLAFALAALLVFRKECEGEKRALDTVYDWAPRQLLHSLMAVNQIPSQLRYLRYVASWNGVLGSVAPWNGVMRLEGVVLRFMPKFCGEGGCGLVFRVYGCEPFGEDGNPKLLYSTPRRRKDALYYQQGDCDTIKVNINCHIKGDVLIESINLNGDTESEQLMFRVMFNVTFMKSNKLLLNRDKIDVLWYAKDHFPKDFRAEILFSEMDASTAVLKNGTSCFEEEGLPIEAFSKVQEIFSYEDGKNPMDDPALNVLQQKHASPNNTIHEKLSTASNQYVENGSLLHKEDSQMPPEKEANFFLSSNMENQFVTFAKQLPDNNMSTKEDKTIKADATLPRPSKSDIISREMPCPAERTSESRDHATDCTNLSIKLPSDFALSNSADTSCDSISPQTPPPFPSMTRSEVHDSHPHKDSYPHRHSPSKIRQHTEETKSQSIDRSQSCAFSSTTGTPVSSTFQNKSPDDSASHPPSSAFISSQSPRKKILPVNTKLDSPPSQSQTPPPPPTPPLREHESIRARPPASPPTPPTPPLKEHEPIRARPPPSPPTPPPKDESHNISSAPLSPPSPPPCPSGKAASPTLAPPAPAPPPSQVTTLSSDHPNSSLQTSTPVPTAPPPPTSIGEGGVQAGIGFPRSLSLGGLKHSSMSGSKNGRILSHSNSMNQTKKLKPLHWLKLSKAVQGSLWAETQKSSEASKAPEIDISELESLFSAAVPSSGPYKKSNLQSSVGPKSDKVQLIDHTRAYNCEILLSKVKVPLKDLMRSVLALEESALDTDQVENLIKFCPTKEEIEVLKGYTGEMEKLGRCEQFFLELMKVPRVESKFRVFSFKIQFHSQVSDLRNSINVIKAAAEEIRNSVKLKRIMQTILSLGNALNQGTAKGSAIGFKLDTLLKLTDTRAWDKNITLMHYLCKVLADKLPEVLDFSKDLADLEPAAKIQLKLLAEEMQAISKGLEKVEHEQSASESDGCISETFCKKLKEYLCSAKAEVSSLSSLHSVMGKNVDALIIYFGEDPSRCPFEQVVTTLLNFTRMFNKAHKENCKQLELDMKKTEESVK